MTSNPAALIACESVLDPILEQLTAVLDEHSVNFAGPVAEALDRLRSTAADTSMTISAAILEDVLGRCHPGAAGLSLNARIWLMSGLERRSPWGGGRPPGL